MEEEHEIALKLFSLYVGEVPWDMKSVKSLVTSVAEYMIDHQNEHSAASAIVSNLQEMTYFCYNLLMRITLDQFSVLSKPLIGLAVQNLLNLSEGNLFKQPVMRDFRLFVSTVRMSAVRRFSDEETKSLCNRQLSEAGTGTVYKTGSEFTETPVGTGRSTAMSAYSFGSSQELEGDLRKATLEYKQKSLHDFIAVKLGTELLNNLLALAEPYRHIRSGFLHVTDYNVIPEVSVVQPVVRLVFQEVLLVLQGHGISLESGVLPANGPENQLHAVMHKWRRDKTDGYYLCKYNGFSDLLLQIASRNQQTKVEIKAIRYLLENSVDKEKAQIAIELEADRQQRDGIVTKTSSVVLRGRGRVGALISSCTSSSPPPLEQPATSPATSSDTTAHRAPCPYNTRSRTVIPTLAPAAPALNQVPAQAAALAAPALTPVPDQAPAPAAPALTPVPDQAPAPAAPAPTPVPAQAAGAGTGVGTGAAGEGAWVGAGAGTGVVQAEAGLAALCLGRKEPLVGILTDLMGLSVAIQCYDRDGGSVYFFTRRTFDAEQIILWITLVLTATGEDLYEFLMTCGWTEFNTRTSDGSANGDYDNPSAPPAALADNMPGTGTSAAAPDRGGGIRGSGGNRAATGGASNHQKRQTATDHPLADSPGPVHTNKLVQLPTTATATPSSLTAAGSGYFRDEFISWTKDLQRPVLTAANLSLLNTRADPPGMHVRRIVTTASKDKENVRCSAAPQAGDGAADNDNRGISFW